MNQSKNLKKSKRKSDGHNCRCGLKKEIDWQGDGVQYPVFLCPDCGPNKRNEWKNWWDKYKDLWQERKSWDNLGDGLSCVVGYFCHRYHEFYNQPYTFSYASPNPYKDKDFVMARRLLAMFNGNAFEAGKYIKWAFLKIVKTPNYHVSSFGFFTKAEFVNRYKLAKSRSKAIRRRTPLPKEFLDWCRENHSDIFERQELVTWNDLNGLVTHVKCYGIDCIEGLVVQGAVAREMLPPGLEYRNLEE